jgi:hypothetical protein
MKSTLNAGNVCYSFVQNVMSFRSLWTHSNLHIEIHKTIIIPVVLNGV